VPLAVHRPPMAVPVMAASMEPLARARVHVVMSICCGPSVGVGSVQVCPAATDAVAPLTLKLTMHDVFASIRMCELSTLVIMTVNPASGNVPPGRPDEHVAATEPEANVQLPTNFMASSAALLPQAAASVTASRSALFVMPFRMRGSRRLERRSLQPNRLFCCAMNRQGFARFAILGVAGVAALGGGACSVFVQLPSTPRLMALSEEQVFSMAPAPDWPQPQADNPTTAAVDVTCGIGPRTTTGLLYAAVAVKGRPPSTALAPLNVSLVLDRSGSMAGDPFRNMINAAQTFVQQLRDGDRVSVVAFSDGLWESVPPVVINGQTRALAVASIGQLQDGGGTFFSGGLLAGLAEVFSAFQAWQVNQVILFSDGQPNIGITSSAELARIAARAADRGVSVTTIGFGQDHDELLMQGIADASGGNYYYVDTPADMPQIFQREAGAILRTAARATDVEVTLPPGVVLEDVIGYDYVVAADGRVYVRMGSIPHGEERYVVLKMRPAGAGAMPLGIVYSDLARRGRFGVSCAPRFDAQRGGSDNWALELAGHAEAAWGLGEAMAWADSGSEIFVISQIGYTRGIIATLRQSLPAGALQAEDQMLLNAQTQLGLKMAEGATTSFMHDGVAGLLEFGKKTAVSTATTAVEYKIDQTFRPRTRVGIQVTFWGGGGTRYAARGTTYKPRDRDGSLRFKRARWQSYQMVRVRP
jgi:hypothetical protein